MVGMFEKRNFRLAIGGLYGLGWGDARTKHSEEGNGGEEGGEEQGGEEKEIEDWITRFVLVEFILS